MVAINPDPHAQGYQHSPIGSITAVFDSSNAVATAIESLLKAGFIDENIKVFVGEEGAEKLDVAGKKHGVMVRIMRNINEILADETKLQKNTDAILRNGGAMIDVVTEGDAAKNKRVAQILKSHGAHDACYWGQLSVEWL